jgi:hypothetical protein
MGSKHKSLPYITAAVALIKQEEPDWDVVEELWEHADNAIRGSITASREGSKQQVLPFAVTSRDTMKGIPVTSSAPNPSPSPALTPEEKPAERAPLALVEAQPEDVCGVCGDSNEVLVKQDGSAVYICGECLSKPSGAVPSELGFVENNTGLSAPEDERALGASWAVTPASHQLPAAPAVDVLVGDAPVGLLPGESGEAFAPNEPHEDQETNEEGRTCGLCLSQLGEHKHAELDWVCGDCNTELSKPYEETPEEPRLCAKCGCCVPSGEYCVDCDPELKKARKQAKQAKQAEKKPTQKKAPERQEAPKKASKGGKAGSAPGKSQRAR